ncbi:MAG: EamA family transporter [Chloroflexota bacterium]|nr:EamA family transporter [Chloroflexota bacterium]MBI5705269.1 EamA family transporter [Chloroflexota bacterium]
MKTKLWVALLALYIVWGSTYLAIRFAVETIPPFLHASMRFLASGIILYAWRRAAGDAVPTKSNWKAAAIVGTFLLLGGNGLVSLAEKTVPSGVAALVIATSPFWLTLFETFRAGGAKPTWLSIVGLVVGFGGVFLLIGPAEITGSQQSIDPFGAVMLLIAPVLWSLGSIYSKNADMPKSTLMSMGMQMLAGAAALFLVSVLTGELRGFNFGEVSMRSWWGLVYLITFGSLVGFVAYGWLLQNAPISLVSTYAYVNPLVAVFLGWLLAGEELNARIGLAAAIIVGAVILINWARQVSVRKEAKEVVPLEIE